MSQKKIKITTNDVSVTPNGKKLVQARLPFKTLASTPKVGIDSLVTGESRKRKLSSTDDDNRSIKLSKTAGAKENIEKTNEVTVLEMVDLANDDDDDIAMTDTDISSTNELTKQAKKSKKVIDVEDKDVPLRRSNRKNDSEVPAKVVIKIPSAKKKKVNERQSKKPVVPKIVEAENDDDDDDDVIPIDSEENSLNSIDGKGVNDKADTSIIILEDDSSFALDDDVKDAKVTDSSTAEEVKEDSNVEAADSSEDNRTAKHENVESIATENDVHPGTTEESTNEIDHSKCTAGDMETDVGNVAIVDTETKQSDAKIDDLEEEEGKVSSSSDSDKTDSESGIEENSSNSLTAVQEGAIDSKVEAKIDADSDQNKVSTPSSSKYEKRTRKSTDNSSMSTPKTPALKTSDNKALTPKQLQKKLESEQKRVAKEKAKEDRERKIQEAKEERERKLQEAKEERERKIQEAKEERERKLQEEKEQRQREKDEKERQRKKERDDKEEQKRKEREDKEEQRRKEKEEREKKKQAEIDAKNEERRQKEEEKVAKEEAELKKKRKEAEAFTKFFAKKSNKSTESDKMDVDEVEIQLNFMPFRVKPDMRLAPTVRRQLSPTTKSKFDSEVLNSEREYPSTDLYIQSLRKGKHVSEKQGKTWPDEENNDDEDDLMIVDDLEGGTPIEEASAIQKYRAKFFKFEENRRPPYYGTWQKKSSVIKPRRPFVTDQKFFDYEVDSDDEWEDEEPGESLHGSDDEKDKESDDDYDIDNEFFVPHGHLSDEELANNDEIDDDNSPDTQKAKLKIMQKVFSDEMKKKTEKIKPRLVGLIWQNSDGSQPLSCPNVIWEMLQMRSMIFNGPAIVMPVVQPDDKSDAFDENGESRRGSAIKKRAKLTDAVVSDLLRLVHGNTNSCEFLSKEFRAFTAQNNKDNEKFQEFSLSSIRLKIKELAEWKPCPDEGPLMNKYCWYASNEQRIHYNMENLSIINDWNYTLTPKSKTKPESKKVKESDKGKSPPEAASDDVPASSKTPKSKLGNIAKFTKVLSDDEKKKNFSIPHPDPPLEIPSHKPKPVAEPSPKAPKKRVKLLMSVPCGQEIPVQTKNSLISQYLSNANANKKSTDSDDAANLNKKKFTDEPICID